MSESGEASNRIKVVDRRRFDESGDLRPDRPVLQSKPVSSPTPDPVEPASPVTPAPEVEPGSDAGSSPAADPGSASATSPLFLDLVAGLAQQAEILMTGGQGMPAQPAEAQRVIEYLTMLESKTKGNVSAEEQQVLSNIIFQLRALFVQQNT